MSYPPNYGYQPPASSYAPQPSGGGIGFEGLSQPAPVQAYPAAAGPSYPQQTGYNPSMYPGSHTYQQAPASHPYQQAPTPYSVAGGMSFPGSGPTYPSQPSGYSLSGVAMATSAFRPASAYRPPAQHQYQQPAQPQYQPPAQPQYRPPAQPTYQPPAPSSHQPPTQPQYRPVSQPQYNSAPPRQPHAPIARHNTLPSRHITTEGTVKDHPNFSAEQDAEILRKAMKGWGCDEKAITHVLASRSNSQRQNIILSFKTMYGRDLVKDLKSELGGHFEEVMLALMMPTADYDAYELRKSMKGLGTDDSVLIEILCTRTNGQIRLAADAFQKLFKRNLEQDVHSETSGHFRRLLVSLCQGNREETQLVDVARATTDAQALYNAGEARWGTDESRFNVILASRSYPQLRATFEEYQKVGKYSIEATLEREMSGDLKDGMVAIVKCVKNTPTFFAEKLYSSMKGFGTDDNTLIRIVVSRAEIDMVQIKEEFRKMYGKTLGRFITDDTSGHYKRVLLGLIGGES